MKLRNRCIYLESSQSFVQVARLAFPFYTTAIWLGFAKDNKRKKELEVDVIAHNTCEQ